MAFKILSWGIAIGPLILGLGIGYVIVASSRGHRTAIKEIVQFTILIGAWLIILYFVPAEWKSEFLSATYLGCSALCVVLTLLNLWRRRQVSPSDIRLDLGRSNDSFWPIVCGLVLLAFSIPSLSDDLIRAKLTFEEGFKGIALISLGICSLFTGLGKTIITEQGIFSWLRFVKWENIKAYSWDEGKQSTLRLQTTSWFPFMKTLQMQVSTTHRKSVQNLLVQKIPGAE